MNNKTLLDSRVNYLIKLLQVCALWFKSLKTIASLVNYTRNSCFQFIDPSFQMMNNSSYHIQPYPLIAIIIIFKILKPVLLSSVIGNRTWSWCIW